MSDNSILLRISIIKTLYFNSKYFGLRGLLKLPVLISRNVKLLKVSGNVSINKKRYYPGMIKIGFGHVGIFDKNKSKSIWEVKGSVIFNEKISIGHGSKISVLKNGELIFGNNFTISAESSIVCNKRVVFGDNVLVSWNCLFMDTDFHPIISEGKIINEDRDIIIGDNVWIGCETIVLKGTKIPSGCVVGARSLLNRVFENKNCLLAGNPAEEIKRDISWEH